MKLLLLLTLALVSPAFAVPETEIELIPQQPMGSRSRGKFQYIEWNAESQWLGKSAPVCKVSKKRMDLSKFHDLALSYEMSPFWSKESEAQYGKQSDGAFHYRSGMINGGTRVASGNPTTHRFMFKVARYFKFERDKHDDAIVGPLPSREQAVVIAREWMKKLGIDENELHRGGEGPDGFDILFRIDLVRRTHHESKLEKEYHYGITLNFAQQIGGLGVLWHGNQGTLVCEIGDGSEFCAMYGKLTGWEKIGDFPVLSKDEISDALNDGFYWTEVPFDCERIVITKVRLEAFHGNKYTVQNHFPLIYTLGCKLHGSTDDGEEIYITMPALKQHRDKYGPRPQPDIPPAQNKDPNAVFPSKMQEF